MAMRLSLHICEKGVYQKVTSASGGVETKESSSYCWWKCKFIHQRLYEKWSILLDLSKNTKNTNVKIFIHIYIYIFVVIFVKITKTWKQSAN